MKANVLNCSWISEDGMKCSRMHQECRDCQRRGVVHLDSVEKVLRAHLDAGIQLKPSKTLFFQVKVDFLGFQVSGDGITRTDRYIHIIRDMLAPKNRKEVASLLGFLRYYREFIPTFARLTEKMNGLRIKRQLTATIWQQKLIVVFRSWRVCSWIKDIS